MNANVDHNILIEAVNMALAGNLEQARVQIANIGDDPTACWIHACLHKLTPDETKARDWYRRSGQFYESYADPRADLAAIKAALTY